MAKKLNKIWELQPHTAAKHTILREYLKAWIRIMTMGYNIDKKAIYIDGFAGPGEYENGQPGSPIIALKESIDYFWQYRDKKPQLRFIFLEADPKRCENLKSNVLSICGDKGKRLYPENGLYSPDRYSHMKIYVGHGRFEDEMEKLIKPLKGTGASIFAFIDPFGFKSMPFETIEHILRNDRAEVFINFMYEDINRFLKLDSLQDAYNQLFGTSKWKQIVQNLDKYTPEERRYFLHSLYEEQLRKAGAKHVISFEMKNEKNATEYFLYFGTKHVKGLEKMKDAMWKVDASGSYTFSDYEANQKQLRFVEFDAPDFSILADQIHHKFKGKTVNVDRVKDFVVTDTPFRRLKHSNAALNILQKDGRIMEVIGRKGKQGFPDGSSIKFRA